MMKLSGDKSQKSIFQHFLRHCPFNLMAVWPNQVGVGGVLFSLIVAHSLRVCKTMNVQLSFVKACIVIDSIYAVEKKVCGSL